MNIGNSRVAPESEESHFIGLPLLCEFTSEVNDMNFVVYVHTNKIDGKKYFGITCKRKPQYRWANGKGYRSNKAFTNAIKKYGWDNFDHDIVMAGLSKEDACNLEQYLIKLHNTTDHAYGYNISIGGECSSLGIKPSAESNEKRRTAMKKKVRTEKWNEAISIAKKGRPNGLFGKTGERCRKSGIVLQIEEQSHKIVDRFYGFDEMQRKTGFSKTPVREASYGIRKRAYGYLWEYQKRNIKNVII